MVLLKKLLFTIFLVISTAIGGTDADAIVTGTVFCDQCKDGQRSLFDFPLYGAKVTVSCANSNGEIVMSREETTNWFGNYAMSFDGTPDLSNCNARVTGSAQQGGTMGCGASAGPAQNLRLMFRVFDMEMYTVDALLAQPAQPMSMCPTSSNPVPPPVTQPNSPPPSIKQPPMPELPPMPPLPPMLPLPPMPPLPPVPFLEASACPHEMYTRQEYRCYWRVVNPDTKVAVAFGLVAARKYGTDLTLWNGLQGSGDVYRTLLREAITALLNSQNSLQFRYPTIAVVQRLNWALMGSSRDALYTALRFKRANSGGGIVTCKFTPCK